MQARLAEWEQHELQWQAKFEQLKLRTISSVPTRASAPPTATTSARTHGAADAIASAVLGQHDSTTQAHAISKASSLTGKRPVSRSASLQTGRGSSGSLPTVEHFDENTSPSHFKHSVSASSSTQTGTTGASTNTSSARPRKRTLSDGTTETLFPNGDVKQVPYCADDVSQSKLQIMR